MLNGIGVLMRQQYAESTVDLEPGMNQRFVGSKRFADAHRIRTIDFARAGIEGTGSLSPRSRRTLAVYIVLVKMGYCGIAAPMGAIADAVFRASHGEAGSIRTLQRANRELEDKGYIHSDQFRPGKRARGAVICFQLDAFAFWTKRSSHNVLPIPTHEHISPDTTSCRPSDRTRNQVASNSQDLSKNEHTEPRAGARASQKTSRKKKSPVLLSVVIVLSKMAMHRADRRAARARAEIELKADDANVELLNPSGVDWAYWERRWPEFSIPVRETTAASQIIPMLLGRDNTAKIDNTGEIPAELAGDCRAPSCRPTAEQIQKVRAELEAKFSLPDEKPMVPTADPANYPDVDESDPEMRELIAARDRTRARSLVNGW